MASLFGSLYTGWLISHVIFLRELPGGFYYTLLLILTTWAYDIGAYVIGGVVGKKKLSPISPRKTVEGTTGGVIFSAVISFLFWVVEPKMGLVHYLIIAAAISFTGQFRGIT